MKLIQPSFSIINQEPGLDGIYKAIESAGRTCYKSENKIIDNYFIDDEIVPPDTEIPRQDGYATVKEFVDNCIFEVNFNGVTIKMKRESSAKGFVDRMVKSGHGAMLEFGTVYLADNIDRSEAYYKHCCPIDNRMEDWENNLFKYKSNKYSKYSTCIIGDYLTAFVTTNYRVLVENGWLDDLRYLCKPTEHHEKRICVKFTTDRGVSHELVRQRKFSFAQESTRYCNYSKDKFGNELTFIIPSWISLEEGNVTTDSFGCPVIRFKGNEKAYFLLSSLGASERAYTRLLNTGCTPQEARQVLPNALKTEINMCGFTSDWKQFFDLRDSSHAHPDMQALAKPLHQKFINRKYI